MCHLGNGRGMMLDDESCCVLAGASSFSNYEVVFHAEIAKLGASVSCPYTPRDEPQERIF